MRKNQSQLITTIGSAFISLLLAGNLYFIKKLVDKIELTEETVWGLKQSVTILQITMDQLKGEKDGRRH